MFLVDTNFLQQEAHQPAIAVVRGYGRAVWGVVTNRIAAELGTKGLG
jgi:hypothetical protein